MGVSDTHTAAAVQQGRDLVRGLREVVLRSGPTIATEIANQLSESGSHELPAALYALAEQATSPNGVDSMKSLASPQPTPCHRTVSGLDEPVTVHCLGPVSIVSHLGSSGWSDGDVKVFEKETLLTPELRKMIEDRNGFSIFDLLDSEDRQVAKRGRVLLRRGPSPEGVSRVEVGSLEWLDNAEAARQQAWGIQNRQEREQALAAVKEQYGGPPVVSRTMQVYPLSDKPRPVPRRPREQGALAGLPSPRDRPPARGRLFAEAVSSSRAPELPSSRPPDLPSCRPPELPGASVAEPLRDRRGDIIGVPPWVIGCRARSTTFDLSAGLDRVRWQAENAGTDFYAWCSSVAVTRSQSTRPSEWRRPRSSWCSAFCRSCCRAGRRIEVLYLSGAAMYRAEVATAELVALTLTPSHLITGAPPRRRRVRRRRPEQQSACPADADLTPAEAAHISAICSRHHIGPQG